MASSVLYSPNEYIYIVCKQSAYIKQLRMSGPIITPLKVKMATAYAIVCSGVKIYQYSKETQQFVLMTVSNAYRKDKFASLARATEADAAPAVAAVMSATPATPVMAVGDTPEVQEGVVLAAATVNEVPVATVVEPVVEEAPVVEEPVVEKVEEAVAVEPVVETVAATTTTTKSKKKKKTTEA